MTGLNPPEVPRTPASPSSAEGASPPPAGAHPRGSDRDGARPGRARRERRPLTWEEVRRRNYVERVKHEKLPFDLLDELPRLAATHYEDIPEDDILRLQWWGLYHDKPKVGTFMMRVKIPGGIVTPQQLRVIGEISRRFGRNSGEISTRQNIQIHWIELKDVPAIFDLLRQNGLTTAGACGDILRNITGCPVAGIDAGELFDTRPYVRALADFFYHNREYSDLPRKHKWTLAACPHQCNAPEIHDVGLVGTVVDGQPGFAVLVGGGLSTYPRLAEPLGVFVPPEELIDFLRALLEVWSNDLTYRANRAKARFKFMVEDHGPEAIRRRIEERLGRPLRPLAEVPRPTGRTGHLGIHPQKQEGRYYIGFPVFPGLISGDQMVAVADLAEAYGGDVRFTREQNLIITGIARADVDRVVAAMAELGFPLDVNPVRGGSIACTGNPHCNYAVGDTKPQLVRLVERLEARFGRAIQDLHIHLDGCPHACGQHWVGDIGIQGTTARDERGEKIPAYDILLRGGLGPEAAIGRPVARRVPADRLGDYVERLVAFYLAERRPGESPQAFFRRHDDAQLLAVMEG